jgi:hypothetical protein
MYTDNNVISVSEVNTIIKILFIGLTPPRALMKKGE